HRDDGQPGRRGRGRPEHGMSRAGLAIRPALATTCVWAQHEPASERGEKAAEANHEGGEGLTLWAWANFALLAGGLTYVFRKSAAPYFAQRTISIRKSMVDADEARADAERRISAVEARLANLPADVQALKDDAMAAARAEHHRVRQEIAAEIAKLRIHAEQDIAS